VWGSFTVRALRHSLKNTNRRDFFAERAENGNMPQPQTDLKSSACPRPVTVLTEKKKSVTLRQFSRLMTR
jgi:hypothetical protein